MCRERPGNENMEAKIQDAVAEERKKWEKVMEGYKEAEKRNAERNDQVLQLEEQILDLKKQQRQREAKVEDEVEALVAKKLSEAKTEQEDALEFLRQESAAKEKAAGERVRATFEKQLKDMEEELRNAREKITELAGLINMVSDGASEQANADWLRDDV